MNATILSLVSQTTTQLSERDWWNADSSIPVWVCGLAALLIIGFVSYLYFRRLQSRRYVYCMWSCRVLAIILTILAILNLTRQKSVVELPELVIAIDVSRSSSIVDQYAASAWKDNLPRRLADLGLDQPTRLALAKLTFLGPRDNLVTRLSDDYRVRFYTIGNETQSLPLDLADNRDAMVTMTGNEDHSRLGDCITQIVEQHVSTNCAAIVVFTDGAVTSGRSLTAAAKRAGSAGIPIFFVGLGSSRHPPDFELSDLEADESSYVGDTIELGVKFSAFDLRGETANIHVDIGETANSQSITIPIDSENLQKRVVLPIEITESGLHSVRIRVDAHSRETTVDNNQIATVIRAFDRKVKVLIVSGYPHPEYRFLKETLVRSLNPTGESTFDVSTLLFDASPGYSKIDNSTIDLFPTDLVSLGQYDVVVLCDTPLVGTKSSIGLTTDELDMIRQYVDSLSGTLVLVPGPRHLPQDYEGTSLEDLFPFVEFANATSQTSTYRIEPSRLADRFKPFNSLKDISQINVAIPDSSARWVFGSQRTKPTAMVLGRWTDGPNNYAGMTWQSYGSGIVVFHGTDESYRWRFRSSVDWFGDYWTGLIKHLARHRINRRGKHGHLSTSKPTYGQDESVELKAEIYSTAVVSTDQPVLQVQIDSGTGETTEVRLLRDDSSKPQIVFRGKVSNLKPNRYLATVAVDAVPITIDANPLLNDAAREPSITTQFEVVNESREFLEMRMQQGALQTSAEVSAGEFFSIQNVDNLWRKLPSGQATLLEQKPSEPVWLTRFGWWPSVSSLFAVAVLLLLCAEWTMRCRMKMI